MTRGKIRFAKWDVIVKPSDPELCECEEGLQTHEVWADFRMTGTAVCVARCCKPCADEFAKKIRDTLPDTDDEGVSE